MVLYEDKTSHSSRMIWADYNGTDNTISFELQDLGEDFEYERSMSGISLDAVLKALDLSDVDGLFSFLQENYNTTDALDRICDEILSKYDIDYAPCSCTR